MNGSGPRSALSFLTPIGGAVAPTSSALGWFPVVGAGIGALLGLLWWATAHGWPLAVAAALVVVADLALTGILHLDGLIDSADGLIPHMTRERRLEVMREPTVGAFGISVAVVVLILRWASLYSIHPSVLLLTGTWCASRAVMALVAANVPYARGTSGGLASAFLSTERRGATIAAGVVGTAGSLTCLLFWRPVGGAVALAAGLVVAGLAIWFAKRRLGGFTGDVLGATGVLFETTVLLVGSARW